MEGIFLRGGKGNVFAFAHERSSSIGFLGCGPRVGKLQSLSLTGLCLQLWKAEVEAPGHHKPALKWAEAHPLAAKARAWWIWPES